MYLIYLAKTTCPTGNVNWHQNPCCFSPGLGLVINTNVNYMCPLSSKSFEGVSCYGTGLTYMQTIHDKTNGRYYCLEAEADKRQIPGKVPLSQFNYILAGKSDHLKV